MKTLNTMKVILFVLVIFLFTGKALAQGSARPTPTKKKAAVIAVMKGGKLEFVGEKLKIRSYVQSVFDEASKGTVINDIYIRTVAGKGYLGLRLGRGDEITGTLFLDLLPSVPSEKGAGAKYISGSGLTYCTSNACKSCEPNGQGGCLCATDPLIGAYAPCYLRPVDGSLVGIGPLITLRLLAEGFEPAEAPVSLDEFLKLKGEQSQPLTIYFDEQQWKNLTKDMKPVPGTLPQKGIRLDMFSSPSIPGGFGTLSTGDSSRIMLTGDGVARALPPIPDRGDPAAKPNPEDPSSRIPDLDRPTPTRLAECAINLSVGLNCWGSCARGQCRMATHVAQGSGGRIITIACQCQ